MKIHLIWAQDYDGGIGINNDLPWHISEDLKNFKKLTLNKSIIMGLNTWISLPFKPLPKRRNIVLSPRNLTDIENYSSIEICLSALENDNVAEVFIVGGAMVYGSFFKIATDLHITLVNEKVDGIDTYFPISMTEIKNSFQLIEEKPLTPIAKYTRWERK